MDVPLIPLTIAQENEVLAKIDYSRERLRNDLKTLKAWILTQSQLPSSAMKEPEAFFCNFLVGTKGDVSRAKQKINNYFKFRNLAKALCSERDPLEQRAAAMWPYFQLLTLPEPTPDGCRVLVTVSGIPDYPDYDPVLIVKRILMIMEMRMRTEAIQGGEYIVLDSKNYSTSYFLAVRPTFMRNVIYFLQNVMPWRIKGIVGLNTPNFLQTAFNRIIKPLLAIKVSKRLYIYTEGYDILSNHFSADMLPRDYGGRTDSESLQEMSDKWMECAANGCWRNWFLNEASETPRSD